MVSVITVEIKTKHQNADVRTQRIDNYLSNVTQSKVCSQIQACPHTAGDAIGTCGFNSERLPGSVAPLWYLGLPEGASMAHQNRFPTTPPHPATHTYT